MRRIIDFIHITGRYSRTHIGGAPPGASLASAPVAALPCALVAILVSVLMTMTARADDVSLPPESDATPPWSDRRNAHSDLTQMLARPPDGRLDQRVLQDLIDRGERLFKRRFDTSDGAGRPMATQAIVPTKRKRRERQRFQRTAGLDANACAGCHHQPVAGGAGDFVANVFVSEGFVQSEFDSTDPQFSNERNTNHLFGSGLVELLAREMTRELHSQRRAALSTARSRGEAVTVALVTKGVTFGEITAHPDGRLAIDRIVGIDSDLVVRPFSHKGVMTSLRQFTVNALNHHHGLQAVERFGSRWTGESDHDEDQHADEVSTAAVSALVAWQASLPPPQFTASASADWQAAALEGRKHFEAIGCAECHRSSLPLESLVFSDPGPLDAAGTLRHGEVPALHYDLSLLSWSESLPRDAEGRILVPLFGDLKRHVIADPQNTHYGNELLSQRFVERNVFMTSELWGVGSTAPYGHRGDLTTLSEAIEAHGGEARDSRAAWIAASDRDQDAVIAFLKQLRIEP